MAIKEAFNDQKGIVTDAHTVEQSLAKRIQEMKVRMQKYEEEQKNIQKVEAPGKTTDQVENALEKNEP